MPRKKYLVTGGNGYIGQHLCKLLYKQGHEVHIVDNYATSPANPMHSYGIFHELDMANQEGMRKLLKEIKGEEIESIFHFAGRTLVGESEENPILYYQDNVAKTFSFIQTCLEFSIKNVVFSSTCATYGEPLPNRLFDESHPQNPINSYGNTKKLIELFLKDLAQKKKINLLILRYFNVAGCSPEGELGENHSPETHLIPNICKAILNKNVCFKIFGNDYPTPDGTCIRDYIHVEDLVKAHELGASHIELNKGCHEYNLGTESGHSVAEVLKTFEKVIGHALPAEIHPRRPGDPPRLVAHAEKIKKELSFSPKYTLEDQIRHMLAYYKKQERTF